MTLFRAFVTLLAAAVLGGCSGAIKLAYDHADSFARWKADHYLHLSGADSDELDDRIDAFHDWHRANALPKYAKAADDAARRMAAGLSQADLVWGYDSLVAHSTESLRAAAEQLAPLLDRVGPEQVKHVERGFAEDNRRFARDYLRGSEEERRKRRVKRVAERLEDWVGRLSDAQRARVQQFAERVPSIDEMRERDRRRLQAGFLDILRERQAAKRLPGFVVRWQEGRDPAYAAASDAFRREFDAMVLDIDRMLTPEQRARAVARLRGYSADFAALAERRQH